MSESGTLSATIARRPAAELARRRRKVRSSAPPGKMRTFWREWIKPLAVIGLVMFSFRSAIADWNDVPTGSMKPTILEGDRIFINKVAYDLKFPFTTFRIAQWDNPKWGDVVVLRSPEDGKRLVKRVIGLPGDVIELRGDRLYRNGRAAIYSNLDQEVIDQIEAQERAYFLFANEEVEGRQHPVMVLLGSAMHLQPPFGPFRDPRRLVFHDGRQPQQQPRLPLLRHGAPQRDPRPRGRRGAFARPQELVEAPLGPLLQQAPLRAKLYLATSAR